MAKQSKPRAVAAIIGAVFILANTGGNAAPAASGEKSGAAAAQAGEPASTKREALTQLGDKELAVGHVAAAIEPYQQALALVDEAKEPLVWCDVAQKLATALVENRSYVEAEPLGRKLVEKRTALLGAEHHDTLGSMEFLAMLLYLRRDYAGSEALYRRTLEAEEQTLGKENPATLETAYLFALLQEEQGHLKEALALAQEAVAGAQKGFPKDNQFRLLYEKCLANLQKKMAKAGKP